ncbi:MAG TPA: 50S ribosomal protein L24 [Candidatus Megaira endosymbiont of Hartmannula sinica]|nr:50S ribosomal protein L24 [Candidatus Megaera endosymbiont of Hartmannula sinica]
MFRIKTGDQVRVISGNDKGKVGKVISIFVSTNKALVEGVKIVKKHVKPKDNVEGKIITKESPIDISNLVHYDSTTAKAFKVGFRVTNEKKERYNKSTGKNI